MMANIKSSKDGNKFSYLYEYLLQERAYSSILNYKNASNNLFMKL